MNNIFFEIILIYFQKTEQCSCLVITLYKTNLSYILDNYFILLDENLVINNNIIYNSYNFMH